MPFFIPTRQAVLLFSATVSKTHFSQRDPLITSFTSSKWHTVYGKSPHNSSHFTILFSSVPILSSSFWALFWVSLFWGQWAVRQFVACCVCFSPSNSLSLVRGFSSFCPFFADLVCNKQLLLSALLEDYSRDVRLHLTVRDVSSMTSALLMPSFFGKCHYRQIIFDCLGPVLSRYFACFR